MGVPVSRMPLMNAAGACPKVQLAYTYTCVLKVCQYESYRLPSHWVCIALGSVCFCLLPR